MKRLVFLSREAILNSAKSCGCRVRMDRGATGSLLVAKPSQGKGVNGPASRAELSGTYFNTCTLLSKYIAVHLVGALLASIFTDILRSEGNVFARLSSSLLSVVQPE
jgi:hypothetical protein